ncbi:adenylyltransferase/cytidyltransferase family protein [Methanocrinis sp.]|uniref:adenylyltransferase/cytidyltransferase family protein n=1 Tax=Methanocrinis sp. TaxID=3101522 RepID=UPI003D106300
MKAGLTRVLATGTFDLLHPGHLMYLEQSRALGDELVVIVARDANVKHKPRPIIPQDQRLLMVSALEMVDRAILGSESDMFSPIEELKPEIITLGYDQHFDAILLKEELATRGIDAQVVRLEGHDPCPLCSSRVIVAKVLEERCPKRDRSGAKD